MAKRKSDYFGLGYVVSLILAIIPVTSWILGAITRFSEGKIVAGLLRLVFGFNIVWLVDLVLMIVKNLFGVFSTADMKIEFENKIYTDKKQALTEFAFCHYPLTLTIDGNQMTFDWFSDLEKYVLSH